MTPSAAPIELLIAAPALQQFLGGQEVQAELLLRQWARDRDVRATFVAHNPALPHAMRWAERVPMLRTIARVPKRLRALWRAARQSEIVHIFSAAHSSFLVATLPAWCVARLLRRPVVVHYHTGHARDHLNRSRLARFVLGTSDAVVVPSRYLAEIFADYGVRTTIVPNTIDASELRFRERRHIRPHLVCTRNLQARYAVDVVIHAFAMVKRAIPTARLCLAGAGPEEAALRALVAALRLDDVDFRGAVPRERIGEVLDGADVFVNASRVDNMPVSILEAFAAGLPVVTTAAGGIPYMVEHERTGLLSEVGDAAGLARNILRVIDAQTLGWRLARNAHADSSRYQWPGIRAEWLQVYRSVVDKSPIHDKSPITRSPIADSTISTPS
jgi:L-malate glycosyltransferase